MRVLPIVGIIVAIGLSASMATGALIAGRASAHVLRDSLPASPEGAGATLIALPMPRAVVLYPVVMTPVPNPEPQIQPVPQPVVAALLPPPPPPPPRAMARPEPGRSEVVRRVLSRGTPEILINVAKRRLSYSNGETKLLFPIAVARSDDLVPYGTTHVVGKRKNPTWRPTPHMRRENPRLPLSVPPGPANPLGPYVLDLGIDPYRIHGTNRPGSIGQAASAGCFRLYNRDIEKLYATVPVGTTVRIVRG
ncbi:MAG: L,D-transpeptidase [Rhodospirillales bacterium]|nr:L,D-transpeptidase [Rhodospirillales bacterium]